MRQHYEYDWEESDNDGCGDDYADRGIGEAYGLAEEDGTLLRMSDLRMVLSQGRLMPFDGSSGGWDD